MAKKRIDTDGGADFGQNPFGGLADLELPQKTTPAQPEARQSSRKQEAPKSYRFEVRRERAGRGGKTVTLIRPLEPVPSNLLLDLVQDFKTRIGAGGRFDNGLIEMQGDHVSKLVDALKQRGHSAHAGN